MAEKTLKSRIIHKHDTAANWLKATTFVPKQGEIIVYDIDADYSYERFKIGDGKTAVNSLPFAGGDIAANTLESAKAYTDAEIAEWVGDKTVSAQVQTAMATKSDAGHAHDDKYYTKAEVNTKLDGKSDKSHTHDLSQASVNYAATAGVASSVAWANVENKPSTYTPATHNHSINDVTNLQGTLDGKVPTSRKVNGKALTGDITLSASDVGADATGSANTALTNAKTYTNQQITTWVGDKTVAAQIDAAIDDAMEYVEGQIVEPVFYVTFTKQANGTYTADKTYTDVSAAYAADQTVMGLLNLGTGTIYHIPVLYCDTNYGIAFHTSLESSEPITIGYGKDGTIVANVYDKIASKADITDAISKITHPVTSVNGQTGSVTLTASSVGADAVGSATSALNSAKSYTDTKISSMVGDKTVSTQITNALASKADAKHNHSIADITDIGDASVSYAVSAGGVAWANVSGKPSEYTPATHSHAISDVTNLQTTLNAKVPTTRKINGKALSSDITLSASDVGADASGSANTALSNAKAYTDAEILEWVGDKTVSTQISNAVASKADSSHTHDDRYYTESEINTKLSGKSDTSHTHSAYVNQNAFSNVKIGSTTIAADTAMDTLTLVGSNVTLTPDATNDKVTIEITKNDVVAALGYTPPTTDTKVTVDSALSSTSTNPVQNKVVNAAISDLKSKVGDTAVATQISNAIASKSDTGHTHDDRYYTETESKAEFLSWNRGAYDVDTLYDAGLWMVASGSNVPSGTAYGVTLTLPYRKLTGNSTPDFGAQIYAPNGDDATKPDSLFYRTSDGATWHGWKEIATTDQVDDCIAGLSVNGKVITYTRSDGTTGTITTQDTVVTVDSSLSSTSTNPVQNKIVNAAIADLKNKVGDTAVATQISNAIASKSDNDHTHSSYVNQNAFSNVKVGSTTVAADSTTDTLTLAGSNVTITPDATNDKITIGITKDNVTTALGYTPPTTNTTYEAAGSSLGLVKSGGDVTISSGLITVNDDSHNHVISNIDGLEAKLNLIGDTAVSTQISNAISSHKHVIADISNIVISATQPSSPTAGMLWFDIS